MLIIDIWILPADYVQTNKDHCLAHTVCASYWSEQWDIGLIQSYRAYAQRYNRSKWSVEIIPQRIGWNAVSGRSAFVQQLLNTADHLDWLFSLQIDLKIRGKNMVLHHSSSSGYVHLSLAHFLDIMLSCWFFRISPVLVPFRRRLFVLTMHFLISSRFLAINRHSTHDQLTLECCLMKYLSTTSARTCPLPLNVSTRTYLPQPTWPARSRGRSHRWV